MARNSGRAQPGNFISRSGLRRPPSRDQRGSTAARRRSEISASRSEPTKTENLLKYTGVSRRAASPFVRARKLIYRRVLGIIRFSANARASPRGNYTSRKQRAASNKGHLAFLTCAFRRRDGSLRGARGRSGRGGGALWN